MSMIFCSECDTMVDTDEFPEFKYNEKTQEYTCELCVEVEETKNKNTYQVWMRTWDTMEYVSPLYLTADSFDDAFNKLEIFRDQYQVKSCLEPGDHIENTPVYPMEEV
jgi:hypothetical protein